MFMHRGLFLFFGVFEPKDRISMSLYCAADLQPIFPPSERRIRGVGFDPMRSVFAKLFSWRIRLAGVKQEPLGQIDAVPFIIIDAQKRVPQ